ncbi:MAG TPA: CHAD domain-containing protein [Blastocatellia bacterium]|nr:CHAD domain-containing protein [Blastocatellia bacterium]
MSFALEENEELSISVKRIAVEQIDLALYHLRNAGEDLDNSVHATRQSLKRLRSLVALVSPELGKRTFKREWTCYRSAGRLLASGRDAAVVVQTFDAVISRFSSELTPEAFAAERCFLIERRDARLKEMVEEGALVKASELLLSARERVATWRVKCRGFKALRRGTRCSYRSSRQDLRSVLRHRTATNFHQWRHPVKLLWHQLQILTPIWPVILNAHSAELGALSDRLNENHDLDVLSDAKLWSDFESQEQGPEPLISLIARRCRELEAEALILGERLFTERPRRFADRIERYFQAWQHGY